MHYQQLPYRELLSELYDLTPVDIESRLEQWLSENQMEFTFFERIAEQSVDQVPKLENADIWRLYACSRIMDWMISEVLNGNVSLQCFEWVCTELGMERSAAASYHPFYHEVVSVEPASDPNHPTTLTGDLLWPGFQLGSMMFCRAGCRVEAGSQWAVKEVAETSPLYWTYLRPNRPVLDLSVGWGGNSQWRTAFRRDFILENRFHFNVDAGPCPPDFYSDLTEEQKVELVRNRCFIKSAAPHDDLCPYFLRHEEVIQLE